MNILFICKHNMFRSRVAEEYMKKISGGKHNISSAGLFNSEKDILSPLQTKICIELGLPIPHNSKTMSLQDLERQDIIVIVADDVPLEAVQHRETEGKLRVWKIKDIDWNDLTRENVIKIIKEIMRKVDELNEELN